MLVIATILFPTISKSPALHTECSRSFRGRLRRHRIVTLEIGLSVPSIRRQHALTIAVLTEISRSRSEEAALAFHYLTRTLEPNFSDFRGIVHSIEIAVIAASGRKIILRLKCVRVSLIPRLGSISIVIIIFLYFDAVRAFLFTADSAQIAWIRSTMQDYSMMQDYSIMPD